MSAEPRSLARRTSRSLSASLLSLLFIAVGGLGAWLVGVRLFSGTWPKSVDATIGSLARERFDGTVMAAAWAVLALLGLLLLLAGLIPGNTRRTLLDSHDTPGETAIAHRDVERFLAMRSEQVNGVRKASVKIVKGTADVIVDSVLDDEQAVRQAVIATCGEALAELHPVAGFTTRVRVRRTN